MPASVRKMALPLTKEARDLPSEAFVLEDGRGQEATIWPALGFNLISWKVPTQSGAWELIHRDPHLFSDGKSTRSGNPILFPFPNRIADGSFTWLGQSYSLEKTGDSGKTAIHGFACRNPWRVVDQGSSESEAWLSGEFDLGRDDPMGLAQWPAPGKLKLTYRLLSDGPSLKLRLEAEVTATGTESLPFGLGYHPYFSIPVGNKARVQAPAQSYWELDHCIPTGKLLPVDAQRNLNEMVDFGSIKVDDVLTQLPSKAPHRNDDRGTKPLWLRGSIDYVGKGRLDIWCDGSFREIVVYTPPSGDAFCIEPYTCPTNAINRADSGKGVGWLTIPPSATWTSTNEWVFQTTPSPR